MVGNGNQKRQIISLCICFLFCLMIRYRDASLIRLSHDLAHMPLSSRGTSKGLYAVIVFPFLSGIVLSSASFLAMSVSREISSDYPELLLEDAELILTKLSEIKEIYYKNSESRLGKKIIHHITIR